ncbi:MAG: DUF86 domain-containing protein [Gaiellales bacterium]|nr:MAG: DUF86 domain-containing protein [Gaiellales bacterium]
MSRRSPELLLEDILESAEKIERYTRDIDQRSFKEDEKTVDAVVRNLEVIGEAANRLPDQFKHENMSIDWSGIIGLRHRIVHDYFGIDIEIVWRIIQHDLPALKQNLAAIKHSE